MPTSLGDSQASEGYEMRSMESGRRYSLSPNQISRKAPTAIR